MSHNSRRKRNAETLTSLALAFILSIGGGIAAGAGALPWWIAIPCFFLATLAIIVVACRLSAHELYMRRIDLVCQQACDALESDATYDDRREAFETIQDLYEPMGPLYQIEAYDDPEPNDEPEIPSPFRETQP